MRWRDNGYPDKTKQGLFWGSVRGSFLLTLTLLLAACQPPAPVLAEDDERAFQRGESLRAENRPDEALQAYLDVIATRGRAPMSHFHAGVLYLESIHDPLAALYHFREHLAHAPESSYREFVEDQMVRAQKDFLRALPAQPLLNDAERDASSARLDTLREDNLTLRSQVMEQRAQIESAQARVQQLELALRSAQERAQAATGDALPIVVAGPSVPTANEASGPRSYTVVGGDTLSRISQKVYNTPNRWTDIFRANTDQLPSPDALRPGQVLRIP